VGSSPNFPLENVVAHLLPTPIHTAVTGFAIGYISPQRLNLKVEEKRDSRLSEQEL
jgi:hypothetical protein